MSLGTNLLIFLRSISSLALRVQSTAGDAQNVFLALCDAWRIAKTGEIQEFTAPPEDPDYTDILYYNMSAADADWHALLDTPAPESTWDKMKVTLDAQKKNFDWSGQWEEWQKQRKHTKKDAAGSSWFKENPTTATAQDLAKARYNLNVTAEIATGINNQLKQPPKANGNSLINTINEALREARCGADGKYKYDQTTKKCTKAATALAKASDCATTENGKSIGHDIVCVCADGTDAACGIADSNTYANGDASHDRIESTAALCPEKTKVQNLADEVSTAIARLGALVGSKHPKDGQAIVGHTGGTTCTHSAADNFVDYHSHFQGTTGGLANVPWIAKLKAAAIAYRQYEADLKLREQLRRELQQLKRRAKAEYERHEPTPSITASSQSPTIETKQQEVDESKVKACAKHNNDETNCTKAGCHYDNTATNGNKCKPKAEKENTAAGTGDGNAGTTSKCRKHQDHKSSEGEPGTSAPGKKNLCAAVSLTRMVKEHLKSLTFTIPVFLSIRN
uniref:Variant surface glycoprotein 1021 n=1 Tax=Trypanosoma brucei TaxID=5691 RepID=M4SVC1_9TRYP|nr:variant surface glycoprotein 1021 [Trypanosoma brucei]